MNDIVKSLQEMSVAPLEKDKFGKWLEFKDAISFLKENTLQDHIVLYASFSTLFMHTILVPSSLVDPPDIEDLMHWNCNTSSSWGICYNFSEPPRVYITPPLENSGSKIISQGEQLVFSRYFEGRLGDKGYCEILQKFIQVFDLHFLAERKSYCRIDQLGDIENVIQIIELNNQERAREGTVILLKRDLLEEYMILTESVLIQTFDFTRLRPLHFSGWPNSESTEHVADGNIYYQWLIIPNYASYMRGIQIVHPIISKETVLRRYGSPRSDERQYASFITLDWKNSSIKEISCAPGQSANYFTKSELPFELSPAFFRPEVLLKYKSDSDKYRLEDRSISCRGAWDLKTYDINEAGQVHTYLVYLRNLPYEEQLYWKSYNERPKDAISQRAFATDFEGKWQQEYDPLVSLKDGLNILIEDKASWWTLRSKNLLSLVHYPATSSADEWSEEILRLDQLLIEGLEEKWLKQKMHSLGRISDPKQQLRSLKLVEECLLAIGLEKEDARALTTPLHKVHNLRSEVKGHASGNSAIEIKRKILSEYGSYRKHFYALCQECDHSIRTISAAFK